MRSFLLLDKQDFLGFVPATASKEFCMKLHIKSQDWLSNLNKLPKQLCCLSQMSNRFLVSIFLPKIEIIRLVRWAELCFT